LQWLQVLMAVQVSAAEVQACSGALRLAEQEFQAEAIGPPLKLPASESALPKESERQVKAWRAHSVLTRRSNLQKFPAL